MFALAGMLCLSCLSLHDDDAFVFVSTTVVILCTTTYTTTAIDIRRRCCGFDYEYRSTILTDDDVFVMKRITLYDGDDV